MGGWASYGLAQGLAAGAQSGSGMLDAKLKEEADARAGDRKLDLETRLLAAKEQMTIQAENRKLQMQRDRGAAITDKADGMLRLDEQKNLDRINAGNTVPGTNVTADEAASMPPETRKLYDLPVDTEKDRLGRRARAAEELGDLDAAKETRGMLDSKIKEEKEDARNAYNDKRLEIMAETQARAQERADRLAELRERNAAAAEKGITERLRLQNEREMRQATRDSLKSVQDDLSRLQRESKELTLKPEQRELIRSQVAALTREQEKYRTALSAAGLESTPGPEQQSPPANRPPLTGFMK